MACCIKNFENVKQKNKAKTWVELLDLRPARAKREETYLYIVLPYDEGIFNGVSQVGGVNVVNKVQLFVDLFSLPQPEERKLLK